LEPDTILPRPRSALLDIKSSWERGLAQRPDVHQAHLEVEKLRLEVRHAKQDRLVSLDLVGRYGLEGSGPERSAVNEGIRDRSAPFWSVGLEVSIPLTNARAKHEYAAARRRLGQQIDATRKLKQRVLIEIDDAFRAAELARERVDAADRAGEHSHKLTMRHCLEPLIFQTS